MHKKITKIWYASYGSNLLEQRFACYIAGGTPPGALRKYKGCANKTLPQHSKPISINAHLYFAKRSKTWHGGGVAFISPTPTAQEKTLGRMYLITLEQFTEVVKQEIRLEEDLLINIEELVKNGFLILDEKSWYNKLLFLGYQDGVPILTFTNKDYLIEELNAPHDSYLRIIANGLKETYGMNEKEITNYLESF